MESDQRVGDRDQHPRTTQQQGQGVHTPASEKDRPPRYIAYLRVSTKKQGAQGLGIEAQRAIIASYVKDAEIIAEFVEVESGSRRTRKKLEEAVLLSKTEKAILITAKLDRLARDTEFAMKVRNNAYDLVCCDIPGMNLFMFGIMAMFAEYELGIIRGRIKAALAAKRARGWEPAQSKKLKEVLDVSDNHLLGGEARKEQAMKFDYSTRQLIVRMKEEGKSMKQIAEVLNSNGQMMPSGKKWYPMAVHRVGWKPKPIEEVFKDYLEKKP